MPVRIEVFQKENLPDRLGETVLSEIHALGIKGVREVRVVEVYLLEGRLSGEQLEKIGSELLADTIVQDFAYNSRLLNNIHDLLNVLVCLRRLFGQSFDAVPLYNNSFCKEAFPKAFSPEFAKRPYP